MLVRRLQPWHENVGKRLVKSPKVFVRDSGLVHALLNLSSMERVLGHPVVGGSWEGFCIETLIAAAPTGTEPFFYRTAAGAELDLVLRLPGDDIWAIEIKRTTAPKVSRGFTWQSRTSTQTGRCWSTLVAGTSRQATVCAQCRWLQPWASCAICSARRPF